MRQALAAASAVLLLVSARPLRGQIADPKAGFLQSLGQFSTALDGQFGDESRLARTALAGMARGLDAWDATMRASETAFASRLPGSAAVEAARMHVAMGAAYLDRGRLTDALREFDAGSHLDPTRADVFTFQGVAQDQIARDFDRAAASFRQAAALDAASAIRAYSLARALDKVGRRDDALKAYQDVLRVWRPDPDARAPAAPFIQLGLVQERPGVEPFFPPVLYADAFAVLERGEFAKALNAFTRAVAADALLAVDVDPRDPMGMGASALRDAPASRAVEVLSVAVEREPARADAHRLLGRALLAARQDDAAVREFRLAVQLAPRDERARLALADALAGLERNPDAEAAFHDALTVLPDSGRAHYRLGRLYQRQNKTVEALAEYKSAARLHPVIGVNRLLQLVGALEAAQQHFDPALDAYSARVEADLNDAGAHRTLGYLYVRLDRRDEALAEFAIALSIAPGLSDVHVAMSQLYLKSADYEAAAGAARRAIALSITNKQARYSLATALMRLGRPDEAKPEFDAFERLQAEDTAAAARQMTVNGLRREAADAVNTRDYERAIAALRKALEVSPGAPGAFEVHEQLASAYAALGRREESERELATSRQLRSDALLGEADR